MNFTQTARGIVRMIALAMAVAVPLAITIEAADARVGGGGSRNFYAFNSQTGAQKWKTELSSGALMTSDPCMIDNNKNIVGGSRY